MEDDLVALVAAVATDATRAVPRLAATLETAYGQDGATIGHAVRSLPGVLESLLSIIAEEGDVLLEALHVLANVCSDAVDARSAETKRALLSTPQAADILFDLLTDDDAAVEERTAVAAIL